MNTMKTTNGSSHIIELLSSDRAAWLSRVVIAVVFLVYGASKITLPETLALSVRNYRLVPTELENLIAITLPWIEVVVAIALVRRATLPGGLLVASGMLVAFLAAVGSALARGLDINCGCFTLSAESAALNNLLGTFILDIFLLMLVIHVWWWLLRNPQESPTVERVASAIEVE